MIVWWPCRIVTPQGTYDPCHFRAEEGTVEILDKAGVVVDTLLYSGRMLAAEGAATGNPKVTQRWQVTGSDVAGTSGAVRWLVEVTSGCGCGGTVTRETDMTELAW